MSKVDPESWLRWVLARIAGHKMNHTLELAARVSQRQSDRTHTTYIQPGKPWQNAYVERYNRTVRHEWLDLYIFETIEEMK